MASFASDFLDVCSQTVAWCPLTGRDQYGKPTWGAPQTFPGRRVFKNTRMPSYERGTKGQGPEVISESQILVLAVLNLSYDDLVYVTAPVADPPPYPPILSWGGNPDETGADCYTKIFLGSANG